MLIFYTDETGDPRLEAAPDTDPPTLRAGLSHYFTLSGVGIRDSSRRPLAEALLRVKRKHFGPAVDGPWVDTEIKGKFLAHVASQNQGGSPPPLPSGWASLDTINKVHAFSRDLGLLLDKFRPLIFVVSIDKREMLRLGKSENLVGLAYTYLQQRIALTIEDIHSGEGALIVADQQSHHEKLYREGTVHQTRATVGVGLHRQPNYNLVLDKPLWIDTELSTWDREILQLADIACYTLTIALERGSPPTEIGFLWDGLRPHFAVHSNTGSVTRWGVTVHPRTAAVPEL